ncbi:MAG: hypothetical protein B7Z15_14525 [Rhizobiales bacterium 32-66-8]|jgi:hypothetical protein|nr:MAG: hypothetical protein B7Z15_14525 [Rhizobiales bacterium 32-66-8]OYY76585.1 MAG: hypothetical protein B7Y61_18330 [Rhizobiales bacterium 35-66-30]
MTTYLVAVHLLVEAGPEPRAAIDAALHDILSDAMRQNAGGRSPLVDWAVAGEDLASSIIPVALPAPFAPDTTLFPAWPAACSRRRGRGSST